MATKIGFTGILIGSMFVVFGLIMIVAGVNSIINGTPEHHLNYDWLTAIGGALLTYGGYYMIRYHQRFTLKKIIDEVFSNVAP